MLDLKCKYPRQAITRQAITLSDRLSFLLIICCLLFLNSCNGKTNNAPNLAAKEKPVTREATIKPIADISGTTILSRFSPPQGFKRSQATNNTFASYLRNFPLLAADEKVHLYNGNLKGNQTAHLAILDIDVGNRDLQQCADAIMRLRAEYLWAQKKYDDIAFDFTNGWRFEYSKWRAGNDLVVDGNKTKWRSGNGPKESYQDFRNYLNQVFMYAGTLSMSKELKPKKLVDMEIGDVFIKGGAPGHAVLVVDLAVEESTGDKAFILVQSYMPAQQIHVLRNPTNSKLSPWYLVSEVGKELITPEWTFQRIELMKH